MYLQQFFNIAVAHDTLLVNLNSTLAKIIRWWRLVFTTWHTAPNSINNVFLIDRDLRVYFIIVSLVFVILPLHRGSVLFWQDIRNIEREYHNDDILCHWHDLQDYYDLSLLSLEYCLMLFGHLEMFDLLTISINYKLIALLPYQLIILSDIILFLQNWIVL